ncbi:UNVERIFIED_ORG: putative membrane protein [Xanthomonas axonopodis]
MSTSALRRPKLAALLITVAVFSVSWISPLWPVEQALHSSLTVLGLLALVWADRRWQLGTGAFLAICVFIAMHCIGARWLYSNVPYEQWSLQLLHWSPSATFGWTRNHFDRLIHLLFGLCFTPAIAQLTMQRWPRLTLRQAFVLTAMTIMCVGLVYEWFEWGIALLLSPQAAEAYNGQQGDLWDAHTDMLLATLGSLAAYPVVRTLSNART